MNEFTIPCLNSFATLTKLHEDKRSEIVQAQKAGDVTDHETYKAGKINGLKEATTDSRVLTHMESQGEEWIFVHYRRERKHLEF